MLARGLGSRQSSIRSKVSSIDNFLTSYYPKRCLSIRKFCRITYNLCGLTPNFCMLAVGKLQIDLTSSADVFFLQKKLTLTFTPNKPNRYLYFRPITAKNTFGISVVLTRRYILFEELARNLLYNHVGTLLLIRLSYIK